MLDCIDGTHVRIQSPTANEYVNVKNFQSISVQLQVMCNLSSILNLLKKYVTDYICVCERACVLGGGRISHSSTQAWVKYFLLHLKSNNLFKYNNY